MTDYFLSKASVVYAKYLQGEATADEMSAILRPAVFRVAKTLASQYAHRQIQDGALNMAEDVTQDVMFHLLTDAKNTFEAGLPIEPFVARIVQRKILKQYLDVNTIAMSRYASKSAENLDHDSFHDSDPEYHHDFETDVDREHARERIRSVMFEMKMRKAKAPAEPISDDVLHADGPPVTVDLSFAVNIATPEPPSGKRARKVRRNQATGEPIQPQYTLTREQLRLAEIMNLLNYTQDEFAVKLGLFKPTLASYLYGRTDSVPDHVMSSAEVCLKADASRLVAIERFHSSSMQTIMLDWISRLGCTPADLSKPNLRYLADVLSVNPVTLERWMGSIRPKPGKYLAYEATVATRAGQPRIR